LEILLLLNLAVLPLRFITLVIGLARANLITPNLIFNKIHNYNNADLSI